MIGVNASKQHNRADGNHVTYRRTVASLCDHAIQSPQPNWRKPWQASHVDHVESVSIQLGGIRRSLILNCLTSAGYRIQAPAELSLVECETPLSASSTESPSTCKSFVSSIDSSTLVSPASSLSQHDVEMDSAAANSVIPCPLRRSQSLTPMKQPDASLPPPKKIATYCSSCNAEFKGSYQNRTSNLRRHLKTVHRLGQPLCCAEPGCGKICGRSDNLRKHRRSVHNIEDPKRHRRSTDVAD